MAGHSSSLTEKVEKLKRAAEGIASAPHANIRQELVAQPRRASTQWNSLLDVTTKNEFGFGKNYLADGNDDFYTKEAIAMRANIRSDPAFLAVLQQFYDTYDQDNDGVITRDEALAVELRICKALFDPSEWHFDDALEAVEADWERESDGKGFLTKERLFDSLFETTDIWCDDIGTEAYCSFLQVRDPARAAHCSCPRNAPRTSRSRRASIAH
jgi:hypothetical protein